MNKRVAFLASGGGSNVEALLTAMRGPGFAAEPVLVLSDRAKAGVLGVAARFGVPSALVERAGFPDRVSFDRAVLKALDAAGPDLLCLAGYMRILSPEFVAAYRGRMLNIHPALLPKFGGPGMYGHRVHEAVLAAGEKESGATVHWVEEGVDAGAILAQDRVPVLATDTAASLAARVLELEHRLYPQVLRRVCGS
jgi:phosphoribosylglycinamide formyltransferase-1